MVQAFAANGPNQSFGKLFCQVAEEQGGFFIG
jgi:hypothetical protein